MTFLAAAKDVLLGVLGVVLVAKEILNEAKEVVKAANTLRRLAKAMDIPRPLCLLCSHGLVGGVK